jgi:hypothetical protein
MHPRRGITCILLAAALAGCAPALYHPVPDTLSTFEGAKMTCEQQAGLVNGTTPGPGVFAVAGDPVALLVVAPIMIVVTGFWIAGEVRARDKFVGCMAANGWIHEKNVLR